MHHIHTYFLTGGDSINIELAISSKLTEFLMEYKEGPKGPTMDD